MPIWMQLRETSPCKNIATQLDITLMSVCIMFAYLSSLTRHSKMWPWNDDEIQTQPDLQEIIPRFPYTVSPRDVLDYR